MRITAMIAKDCDDLNAERSPASYKSGYNISYRSYLFGALRYDKDKFSSLDYQASLSAGYGVQLLDDDIHSLLFEIGPGVRRAVPVDPTESTETNAIGRLSTEYEWNISETANLPAHLQIGRAHV